MDTAAKKQDMPPQGGYRRLDFSRNPARVLFGGKTWLIANLAVTAGALYLYTLSYKKVNREEIERRSSMLAILPLLTAENDRAYLKQVRKNRDEESKLMANVPGWETGTYYGEPIYKTYPKDTFVRPHAAEFFVHGPDRAYSDAVDHYLWN